MPVWAMVETPTAVFDVRAIAGHPAVAALVLGTNDLAKELRAALVPGRAPLLPHLATALLGAREAGKAVLDGVYNDVKDLEGFEAECRQGAELGFDGKTLVHPSQVEVANRVWAPTEAEVEHARAVVDAFAQAEREGKGRRRGRRPDGGEPAPRQRPAHARRGGGRRRAGLTLPVADHAAVAGDTPGGAAAAACSALIFPVRPGSPAGGAPPGRSPARPDPPPLIFPVRPRLAARRGTTR